MQELQACRRPADLVGGGDAGPKTCSPAYSGSTEAQSLCGLAALPFREVWVFDFEFCADAGENPEPVCLVAWEMRSGRRLRLWRDEFGPAPPYPTGPDVLIVAYYASAEISCHLALGWPVPERVLDLFTEFRNRTNGIPTGNGASLLGALAYHGLDGIGAVEKDECATWSYAAVLGPTSSGQRFWIIARVTSRRWRDYYRLCCQRSICRVPSCVAATWSAVARIERNGVPIDVSTLDLLRRNWSRIQDQLIAEIDADYGVYDGRSFQSGSVRGLAGSGRNSLAASCERPP